MEEFDDYLSDLENAISALQPTGRVIIAGDFNAHMTKSDHCSARGSLLQNCIHRHSLFAVSTSDIASGPHYTFFSSNSHSTVNYILAESFLVSQVLSYLLHQHHPLNLSDHLPILLSNHVSHLLPRSI